jgi:hypothetical protein
MTEVEYVLSKLKDEVKNMEYDIARGTAKDYAEYQYLCGKLRGLLVAEDIIKALKERMEKDDE